MAKRLNAQGVADLLGIGASTVRSYAARGQMPKPSPCPCCDSPTWDVSEVKEWNRKRLHGPRPSSASL